MVTKEQLDQLRALRRRLTPTQALTPNNAYYSHLGRLEDMKREAVIRYGEQQMGEAHKKLRLNYGSASIEGVAKARFNIRAQKTHSHKL